MVKLNRRLFLESATGLFLASTIPLSAKSDFVSKSNKTECTACLDGDDRIIRHCEWCRAKDRGSDLHLRKSREEVVCYEVTFVANGKLKTERRHALSCALDR